MDQYLHCRGMDAFKAMIPKLNGIPKHIYCTGATSVCSKPEGSSNETEFASGPDHEDF